MKKLEATCFVLAILCLILDVMMVIYYPIEGYSSRFQDKMFALLFFAALLFLSCGFTSATDGKAKGAIYLSGSMFLAILFLM